MIFWSFDTRRGYARQDVPLKVAHACPSVYAVDGCFTLDRVAVIAVADLVADLELLVDVARPRATI